MTFALAGYLLLIGFVLGLIAQDWAARGLEQAARDARKRAPSTATPRRYGTRAADPEERLDCLAYGLGASTEVPPELETLRTLGDQFPDLTLEQLVAVLIRRRQERKARA